MPTTQQSHIEHRLRKAFSPTFLKIMNESEKHRGHVNGPQQEGLAETHFAIKMVSTQFNDLSRLARHRLVHNVLVDLMPHPIHALRLQLLGSDENRS